MVKGKNSDVNCQRKHTEGGERSMESMQREMSGQGKNAEKKKPVKRKYTKVNTEPEGISVQREVHIETEARRGEYTAAKGKCTY